MKRRLPILSFAVLVPAAAAGQPAAEPIACVYDNVSSDDLLRLSEKDAQGRRSPEAAAAEERQLQAVENCGERYHWSMAQARGAVLYAIARAEGAAADAKLVKLGLPAGFADAIAAALGPEGVDALAEVPIPTAAGKRFEQVVAARLEAIGYPPRRDAATLSAIAELLGLALGARTHLRRASAEFRGW